MNISDAQLERAIEAIADHAIEKHITEFADAELGPIQPIANSGDLAQHVRDTLADPNTRGAVVGLDGRQAYFYNDTSNTFVALDLNTADQGTVYRPKAGAKREGLI